MKQNCAFLACTAAACTKLRSCCQCALQECSQASNSAVLLLSLLLLILMLLLQARQFGTYLIAGVHGDDVVNARRGLNMPIMNLNERVLR
jgi:hypothetical protein